MKPFVTLLGILCLVVPSARAGTSATYEMDGRVTLVTGSQHAMDELASLGVTVDAPVHVTWVVQLDTLPFETTGDASRFFQAATINLTVGIYYVRFEPADNSVVSVGNSVGRSGLDYYRVEGPFIEPYLILASPSPNNSLVLDLSSPDGEQGSLDHDLAQDPDLYPLRLARMTGSEGKIYFDFGPGSFSNGPPFETTARCSSKEIGAAAARFQSQLNCLAKDAKHPDAAKLADCEERARRQFVVSYHGAVATAAKKGVSCLTLAPAQELSDSIDALVAAVDDAVRANDPAAAVAAEWLAAAAKDSGDSLRALARNAAAGTGDKLLLALDKARAAATARAAKAVSKAEADGVAFDPEPDVAGFVETLDQTIAAISDPLSGY